MKIIVNAIQPADKSSVKVPVYVNGKLDHTNELQYIPGAVNYLDALAQFNRSFGGSVEELIQATKNKREAHFKNSNYDEDTKVRFKLIEDRIFEILYLIGEEPLREGLVGTPYRVAKMLLDETMAGYAVDLEEIVKSATFEAPNSSSNSNNGPVIVTDIDFYSNCEHHMVPFFGKVHIAYIPKNRVMGLSKMPRLVKAASKTLNLQEGLGDKIAEALFKGIDAKAVAVIVEAEKHLCVAMRGVESTNSKTVTMHTRYEVNNSHVADVLMTHLKDAIK